MRHQHIFYDTLFWLISVSLGPRRALNLKKANILCDVYGMGSIYTTSSFLRGSLEAFVRLMSEGGAGRGARLLCATATGAAAEWDGILEWA
jgi:hypothetical protein